MSTNLKEYNKAYYEKNRERIRAYRKSRRKQQRDYARKWRANNRKKYNKNQKAYRHERRLKIIDYYSNGKRICACCEEKELLCLTLDHINGDGKVHRAEVGQMNIDYWIYKNNFPAGLQVLCYNCNFAKFKNNNICPHQQV